MRDSRHSCALVRAATVLLLMGIACDGTPADTEPLGAHESLGQHEPLGAQWYHAQLIGREEEPVPFFLQLPDDCEQATATVVNGEERISARCHRSESGFLVDFPVNGSQLEAEIEADGTLTGHLCRERAEGRSIVMSLAGRPIAEPDPGTRFPLEADVQTEASEMELEGTWQMEFDVWGEAKGTFVQQADGVVRGTIEVPVEYGDLRFLAGNVRGRRVRLSTFNGRYAVLVDGELMPDGTLEGTIFRNDTWDPFVAERMANVELPDPLARVRPIRDDRRLDLEQLSGPRYAGKAVVVDIFGTWCPNCGDQTPLLTELYQRHHDDGLEILGLAYEFTDNLEFKQRRIQAFRQRYDVEWEIVIAGLAELASEGNLGLSPIEGVPVTVFVNRDGTVHAVYTGFSGPATGDAYVQLKADFERLTREIVDGT